MHEKLSPLPKLWLGGENGLSDVESVLLFNIVSRNTNHGRERDREGLQDLQALKFLG